jgi:predicted metal-binding membrane protein
VSLAERSILYAALALATAAAWWMTYLHAPDAAPLSPHFLSPYLAQAWCGAATWTAASAASSFLMWVSMMAAMMLPTAAPMLEAVATIATRRQAHREPYTPAFVFVVGYLFVWSGFSALAAAVQWLIYEMVSSAAATSSLNLVLPGVALVIAGAYQFTPAKRACMRGCRSPMTFILTEWREGYGGALQMGFRHGVICVGCCWALMSLMFCVSMMDLRWAAALAIYAAAEKFLPGGDTVIAPAFGLAAIVGGAALIGYVVL